MWQVRERATSVGSALWPSTATQSRPAGRALVLNRALLCADAAAAAITGAVIGSTAGMPAARVALLALACCVAWPVVGYAGGLYSRNDLLGWASGIPDARRLLASALLLSWPAFALLSALSVQPADLWALGAAAAVVAAVAAGRVVVRTALHRSRALTERVVIVGSGDVARSIVERMRLNPQYGLEPVGIVDDDTTLGAEIDAPWLGQIDGLGELLAAGKADRVVIAFTLAGHEQLLNCIRTCSDAGVPVSVVPRLFELLHGVQSVDRLAELPLVSIQAPSFSPLARVSKRTFDIVCASVILLVLAPLLVAVAVAIKLDSPGPIFFVQKRSGRDGRYFRLYKLRSMTIDATVLLREPAEIGAILKTRGDRRVTRVGRFMRRFSLDEAPQLLNVLRGDMSLVGPRPLVHAEQSALVDRWQLRRSDMRPGLTGLWQTSGRSDLSFEEMINLDYQYVAGWSLARDSRILLATLPVVFSGRGAF